MPQEGLNPIVQRMIDAGESEENIATVIQHYKGQAAPAVSALDMVSGKVGRDTGADPQAPDWKSNLAGALEPMAHPQTAEDFAGLLLPTGGAAALGKVLRPVGNAVTKYGGAAAELGASLLPTKARAALSVLGELKPTTWNSPLTVAGREGRAVAASQRFNELPLSEQMKSFADTPAPITTRGQAPPIRNLGNEAPLPPPPAPTGPHMDLSTPIRPGSLTQRQIAERLAAVQEAGGLPAQPAIPPRPPLGGRMPMEPLQPMQSQGRPPITVSPESAMQPDTPLQQPRVQIGAEKVGRQNGLTTQQVRDTTGPIRGEAPGEAAGMPVQPKDRIVQKLIDMGPKGQGLPEAEREAYAAKGTSEKTRLQVQAYLDALRKVGFVGVGAAGARQALLSQLGDGKD